MVQRYDLSFKIKNFKSKICVFNDEFNRIIEKNETIGKKKKIKGRKSKGSRVKRF